MQPAATRGRCRLKGGGGPAVPLVISRLSLRPPHREMAMDGRSLGPSDVLSTPLSTPELPTDCGDWLAERAPLSLAGFASPEGSPLKGEEREGCAEGLPACGAGASHPDVRWPRQLEGQTPSSQQALTEAPRQAHSHVNEGNNPF